jgi:hypothetical protein
MIEAKEFLRRCRCHDAAGLKQHDARGKEQSFVQIVRDENNGFAEAAGERAEFTLQLGAGNGIERPKRFVHQQDGRIGGEGAGHSDALALATGKFARTAICELPSIKAHEVEHFLNACGGASGLPSFQNGNESHIFRNRKMREKTGILNNVPNASTKADQIPSPGRALLDEDFPLRGHQHSIDQAKKCGLSATTAAEQDERLTLRNG